MKKGKIILVAAFSIFLAALILPSITTAHNGPFDLPSFVILTNEDIIIPGFFTVNRGNVCSRAGDITLGGSGSVKIPRGACTDTDWDVIATTGTITKNKYTFVSHARGTVVDTSVAGCDNLEDPAIACPDNPPFPIFSTGANDVTCTTAGTDIIPGNYQDLIIQNNGICNFRGPGNYNFRRIISVPSHYQLNFLDRPEQCDPTLFPFNVNVKEFAFLAEFGKINFDETPSVFFNVQGVDGTYGGANKSPIASAFTYMGDGVWITCYVFVPNGTIGLRGTPKQSLKHHEYHSQWIGNRFQQIQSLLVVVELPINPECCIKVKECACIFDFADVADNDKKIQQGGTLAIFGEGFTADAVNEVLFFKTTNTTVNYTNPAATADCTVSNAAITFVSTGKMELVVPLTCPTGDYHIGVVNGSFSIDRTDILTIQ